MSLQVMNIRKLLNKIEKPHGLYPNFLSPVSGNWVQRKYSEYCTQEFIGFTDFVRKDRILGKNDTTVSKMVSLLLPATHNH